MIKYIKTQERKYNMYKNKGSYTAVYVVKEFSFIRLTNDSKMRIDRNTPTLPIE